MWTHCRRTIIHVTVPLSTQARHNLKQTYILKNVSIPILSPTIVLPGNISYIVATKPTEGANPLSNTPQFDKNTYLQPLSITHRFFQPSLNTPYSYIQLTFITIPHFHDVPLLQSPCYNTPLFITPSCIQQNVVVLLVLAYTYID